MIKIEFETQRTPPKNTQNQIEKVLECIPREHLRGIERIKLVDKISDPRLRNQQSGTDLPGLYHPRQGAKQAWLEIAIGVLLPRPKSMFKRIMPRLSFKGNLSAIIFSLIGQHYYITLRHSIKRNQIETAVRTYTEKHLRIWHERQHSVRSKLFKPLQPKLERWGRALQKRAAAEKKRKQSLNS